MTAKPPWMTPLSARAPRSRRKPEARREELLQRLEQVILAEGFARLTVDDMASRLQCSKSTLYAIASSKEQLVAATVRHFLREGTERIEVQVAPVLDPAAQIATYVGAVGTELRRMSADFLTDLVTTEATAAIYEAYSLAVAGRVRELVESGVASGAFRDVHAGFVGAVVSLLVEGIQHGALPARAGVTATEAYQGLSDLVLHALGK